MRQIYKEYIGLTNKGAKKNGYTDRGEAWRLAYEVDNFDILVEKLWRELKPFYIKSIFMCGTS